ncbi:MAG: hypothetical protein S4CHLAM6_12250 [Chlamydiae bacterium]|nr:hypothetical protein [Chlamydiota bacterium]
MDLTANDVSKFLQVSEEAVLTWTKEGKVPSYQLSGEYRFNREEIEEWMLRQVNLDDLHIDPKEHPKGLQQFNLYRALHKGLVLKDVEGESKEELIRNSMEIISKQLEIDAEVLTNLLLDREKLMSTAINRGVAVPHAREFLLSSANDIVAVVHPKTPLEYGALDGEKVHTLFFLFACQDKRHLNLLAKIAFFCHQPENLEALKQKLDKRELLSSIKAWESNLNQLQPA